MVLVLLLTSTVSATPPVRYATALTNSEAARLPGPPAWFNINSASVQKQGSFHFELTVGGDIPSRPSLLGYANLAWEFGIGNNTTAPSGWPLPSSGSFPGDYMVLLWWDGTQFSSGVADRTPLLTGGKVTITPVPFTVNHRQIDFTVTPSLLGNPANFSFYAVTDTHTAADIQVNTQTHTIRALAVAPRIWGSEEFWQSQTPVAPDCAANMSGYFCSGSWSLAADGSSWVTVAGSPNWWFPTSGVVSGERTVAFTMNLAGALPKNPVLAGAGELFWLYCVDTNRTGNPDPNWPLPTGNPDECEYWVFLVREGAYFAGAVVNSTPALTGGNITITPVPYTIAGSRMVLDVPRSDLGNPSRFGVVAINVDFTVPIVTVYSATHLALLPGSLTYNPENFLGGPSCSYLGSNNGDCFTTWHA